MLKKCPILISTLVFFLLVTGCGGSGAAVLDESFNGKTVNLKVGDTLEIQLKSDPINGYEWQVERIDPAYLQYNPKDQYTPVGQDPVAGGTQVLSFQALKTGTTQLGLTYQRASGEGVGLPKKFEITLNIQ